MVTTEPSASNTRFKWILRTVLYSALAFAVYCIYTDDNLRHDFTRLSLMQYQIYVYGKSDYCEPQLDAQAIMQPLGQTIFGQPEALAKLGAVLIDHQNISSIAIVGPQGVGKSLTLNTIAQAFPWQYNMHHVTWDATASQQAHLHRLSRIQLHLTTCGLNGIFVDNIPRADANIIAEFDATLRDYCQKLEINVIAFYVFNDNEAAPSPVNATPQFDTDDGLITISDVVATYYRRFNAADLKQCIAREMQRLGVTLTEGDVQHLMQNIDILNTGCKTVAAKVARHIRLNS